MPGEEYKPWWHRRRCQHRDIWTCCWSSCSSNRPGIESRFATLSLFDNPNARLSEKQGGDLFCLASVEIDHCSAAKRHTGSKSGGVGGIFPKCWPLCLLKTITPSSPQVANTWSELIAVKTKMHNTVVRVTVSYSTLASEQVNMWHQMKMHVHALLWFHLMQLIAPLCGANDFRSTSLLPLLSQSWNNTYTQNE